jgi:transposase
MRPETRDRRKATWKLLKVDGVSEAEATSTITAEYDVAESTVRKDINTMAEWLPEVSQSARVAELSLVYEVEETRQRLYEMAEEAQDNGDVDMELKIQQRIIDTIKLSNRLRDDIDRDPREETLLDEMMNDSYY